MVSGGRGLLHLEELNGGVGNFYIDQRCELRKSLKAPSKASSLRRLTKLSARLVCQHTWRKAQTHLSAILPRWGSPLVDRLTSTWIFCSHPVLSAEEDLWSSPRTHCRHFRKSCPNSIQSRGESALSGDEWMASDHPFDFELCQECERHLR
jgi:hypothetical protein